jgi:hypothetical protein
MTECQITSEQIEALAVGQRVAISYLSMEEYGEVVEHELELVPPMDND